MPYFPNIKQMHYNRGSVLLGYGSSSKHATNGSSLFSR